jgi:arylformamidase
LRLLDLTAGLALNVALRDIHSATHIEAPAYLIADGKNLDQFALDSFSVQAVLLDLTIKAGQPIDDEDLEAAEERAGLALHEGEAVVLHTGWGDSADTHSEVGRHAYLSENGAEFLEFKRPSLVAIDAPSLDDESGKRFPAHSTLMRSEILVLENLRNLDLVQESRFRLLALPLKLSGPTSPVRAVAVIEE